MRRHVELDARRSARRRRDRLRPLRPARARVPVRGGRAWDFEEQRDGRRRRRADRCRPRKLYCVDSFDRASWSNSRCRWRSAPARTTRYEAWIVDAGRARPSTTTSAAPQEIVMTGCSMGAYHAANFALRRADLFPLAHLPVGQLRPVAWNGWGERGDAAYFHNPMDYVAHLTATTWTGCARASASLLVVRAGPVGGHDRRAATARARSRGCSARRACATSSTSGGTTSRTTGRPGAPSSPTTCPGSADGRTARTT